VHRRYGRDIILIRRIQASSSRKTKGVRGQVPEASQAQITHQSFLQNHSTHPGPVQKLNGFPVEQHFPPQ
jgi:hypothetical protein